MDGDDVIGHVIATRGWLEPLGHPALGLGPLGVRPEHQRTGVGTVLVHALLAVAEAADERLVALLGSPDYYRRFGFVPAADLGVTSPDPAWGGHFQARHLNGPPVQRHLPLRRPLRPALTGTTRGIGSFTHAIARTTRVKLPLPGLSGGGPAAG